MEIEARLCWVSIRYAGLVTPKHLEFEKNLKLRRSPNDTLGVDKAKWDYFLYEVEVKLGLKFSCEIENEHVTITEEGYVEYVPNADENI